MSAKPAIAPQPALDADWLEALPLAALLVDTSLAIVHANSAAQPLAANLRTSQLASALGNQHPLVAAILRALKEGRSARLDGISELNAAACWVTPFINGQALLLLDLAHANDSHSFTQLSSTMAAMLAHEIRNPLLSIKGAAQLLEKNAGSDDAPLCSLIAKEVDRLEQLVATLDPLSAAPAKTFFPFNIHEALEHARLATAAAFPNVRFVIDYDPSLPPVMGARGALIQAFANLLKNAAEAVAKTSNPAITLSTRYVVGETRRNPGGTLLPVAVSVTDNGGGIDPSIAGKLFAPFATTKKDGRGLGLAIVARIIEEHQGLICSDDLPAGGARFTLYLPVAPFPASPA